LEAGVSGKHVWIKRRIFCNPFRPEAGESGKKDPGVLEWGARFTVGEKES